MTDSDFTLRISDQHFCLISLPDSKGESYFIQFPKVILSSISDHYCDLFETYKDVDHEHVKLTKKELELFEAICFIFYKKYIDPDQRLMVSLPFKFQIEHIDNMKEFFNKICYKKEDFEKIISVIKDLFKDIDIQFSNLQLSMEYKLNYPHTFIKNNFLGQMIK